MKLLTDTFESIEDISKRTGLETSIILFKISSKLKSKKVSCVFFPEAVKFANPEVYINLIKGRLRA